MVLKSYSDICKCKTESFVTVKSCFSYDDWMVLKKHPEVNISIYKEILYCCTNLANFHNKYQMMYEIGDVYNKEIQVNCGKVINLNMKNDMGRNNYEYLLPYQKKLKEQRYLQLKLNRSEIKGRAKRHRKVLIDDIQCIMKPAIRRLDIVYQHLSMTFSSTFNFQSI